MHEVPRTIWQADLGEEPGSGLTVAVGPGGAVVVQLALSEARLRACSESWPPSCSMPPDAAVDLARELLRELRPDLARHLEVAERRAGIRVVNGNDLGGDVA